MKLHITDFTHNSPMFVSDILEGCTIAELPSGIIRVRFFTKSRPYYIDTHIRYGRSCQGPSITFRPYIYTQDGWLSPIGFGHFRKYYSHKDFFSLECTLDTKTGYHESIVIPDKKEYLWTIIPDTVFCDDYEEKPLELVE